MKRVIESFLVCMLVFSFIFSYTAEATVTEHDSVESEELIWNELTKYTPSDAVTAGIMGFFMRESQFKSNALVGWIYLWNPDHDKDLCDYFVEEIDSGLKNGSTRDAFVDYIHNVNGGFGLGQWYSEYYLERFYDFVAENGESIGDAEIQCEFTVQSIKENEELWELISESDDAFYIGRMIGYMYDGTGQLGSDTIAAYSKLLYERYAEK